LSEAQYRIYRQSLRQTGHLSNNLLTLLGADKQLRVETPPFLTADNSISRWRWRIAVAWCLRDAACVSWTVFDDQHSAFAVNYWQYKTLVDCQAFCASYPPCIAIDFDSSDTPCWVHTDLSNLQPDLTFPNPDVSQFIIRRDCQRKPSR